VTADIWIENIALIGTGVLFMLLATFYLKRPPQKINEIYGYRTRRSRANQDIWDAANGHSSKSFFKLAVIVFILGVALCFFSFQLRVLIQIGVLLIGLGISVWDTESYLNRFFDKNGNRKS